MSIVFDILIEVSIKVLNSDKNKTNVYIDNSFLTLTGTMIS